MKIFGIFGDPIEHSLSPAMHSIALRALGINACYHAFRVRESQLEEAIRGASAMGLSGLNLTIPHKERALALDILELDPLAEAIRAVNTLSFQEERIVGYNTDGWGARLAIEGAGVEVRGSRVLLIGAGGAARAVAYTLSEGGAELSIANRSPERAEKLAHQLGAKGHPLNDLEWLAPQSDIIINCTSIGMRAGDPRLLKKGLLHRGQAVFDIVYNRETELLADAKRAGAIAIDGVMMLVHQGAKALEIWTGMQAPVDLMREAVIDALAHRQACGN